MKLLDHYITNIKFDINIMCYSDELGYDDNIIKSDKYLMSCDFSIKQLDIIISELWNDDRYSCYFSDDSMIVVVDHHIDKF